MHYIYTLRDPRDKTIRYVGRSETPLQRYGQHLALVERNSKKDRWIQELFDQWLLPEFAIIDTAEEPLEAGQKEAEWIQTYLKEDMHLLNRSIPSRVRSLVSQYRQHQQHVNQAQHDEYIDG